jgi:hypothetical protein
LVDGLTVPSGPAVELDLDPCRPRQPRRQGDEVAERDPDAAQRLDAPAILEATAGRKDEQHDADDRPDEPEGGSGTVGDDTEQQRQAGAYGRDAEQDPALGRHRQDAE